MDGTDLQRRIGGKTRRPHPELALESLRRQQRPPAGGTAEDCLKVARDPERRLEPLRRNAGARDGTRA
ncbi:hypothetical protein [Falsiroseomonas oryzae]|uniref:hypothetical protein n=1 Tax=Falsiroseomonas oryzae TaxID=2766473 RepID=UPI0022EAD714|nr:hypothetical protein [Roseomonas sp. MO-31]